MSLRSARRDDERGAILVMSALFLVVMVVACALAIDLGQQAKDKRDDHKIADLVSLDAVRALDDINGGCTDAQQQTYVESKAHDAAVRNSYDPSVSGHSLVVDIGNVDANKNFTPAAPGMKCWPNSKAVRVTVGSVTNYQFLPGSASQLAKAVSAMADQVPQAWQNSEALYDMGSYMGSIDSNDSALLNKVLGKMFKGSDLSGTLVGWQGVGTTAITLDALKQKLSALGVNVGTEDELMNSQIQLSKILTAESQALNDQNTIASGNASTLIGQIAASVNGTTTVSIGQIMGVSQGQGQALAAHADKTFLRSLATLSSAAQIENGNNFSVADLGLSIPGVSSTGFSMSAISPPVPVGTTIGSTNDTHQVHITVTPAITNLTVPVAGLVNATVSGNFPLTVDGGGAHGLLQDAKCLNTPGLTAQITSQPYTTATPNPGDTLGVTATILGLQQQVANVVMSASQTWTSTTQSHTFGYPTDFPLPGISLRMGGNTVGLDTQTYTANATVLGGSVSGATIGAAVKSAVTNSVLVPVNSRITRLVQLLGLEIGGADVSPDSLICDGQIGQGGAIDPVLVS